MRRREPFVWLPEQPFDHPAGFATLRGAPLRRNGEGTNRWVLARGRFDASEPAAGRLSIFVDGRYRLWLNGEPIARGPGRASPHFARYDGVKVKPRRGSNVLAALVHVPGVDLAWYETVKGGWQPVFGDGGLWAELELGGRPAAITWRLHEAAAWRRDTARSGWGQDFIEDFDARAMPAGWTEPGFDDGGWALGRAMVSLGTADETARGYGRVEPFPALLPSTLPPASETPTFPSELIWVRSIEPGTEGLPPESRLYAETYGPGADERIDDPAAMLRDDDDATIVRSPDGGATAIMLAFDYHAGRPFIELEAAGGETVEIAVAEALPGEFGIGRPDDGLRNSGHLGVAHLFRYTARAGIQSFEKFGWTAVRAMQVVVRDAPDGIAIRRIGSVATHYPAVPEGAFECSDPLLNRLWKVGRHTVLQCMHDGWVDCPGREARQWVGDAVVQFDVAALAFGASVYPLQRQFLQQAAESQRADGLVRMFAPGDLDADVLVIPDFTLLWVIGAQRYHRLTGDLGTIEALLPAIVRALGWFERNRNSRGLLADFGHWHFIEWAHLGREGESAPVNALYAGALAAAADLADAAGWSGPTERFRRLRDRVVSALDARHWDERRGLYVDSVDPATSEQHPRASQHANALMLLFDLADPARRTRMVRAITDPQRLKLTAAPPIVPSAPSFDEERDIVRANTFFAHFVYAALAEAGHFGWVLEDIRASYGPMLAAGTTTLWESYTPEASLCHGFSATPVHQLSRHCLGIAPETPGFAQFSVRPEPGDLDWARGTVPTPRGKIEVEWTAAGDALTVRVRYPDGCRPVVRERMDWCVVAREDRAGELEVSFEAANAPV